MYNKKSIFLTGATGLIGSYLSKLFIEKGHKVHVLARKKNKLAAKDRVESMLLFWNTNCARKAAQYLNVIEGDMLDLDITKKILRSLPNEKIEIFHCAAITDINYDSESIRNVNVSGTEKILLLAKTLSQRRQLIKFNYLSTAYVCGDYQGSFKENMLDMGQSFKTQYASSKFEAEKLIWQFRRKFKFYIDIFRPPIVVGTSKEGKINEFKNIYQLINLCRLQIFNSLPFCGVNVSLIPVDYLANMIYYISTISKRPNSCFHVFLKRSFSLGDIIGIASRMLYFKKPKMCLMNKRYIASLTPVASKIINYIPFLLGTKAKFSYSFTYSLLRRHRFQIINFDKKLINNQILYFKKVYGLR